MEQKEDTKAEESQKTNLKDILVQLDQEKDGHLLEMVTRSRSKAPFEEIIKQQDPTTQRQILKTALTVLDVDPTDELCSKIDSLILGEREERKLIDFEDIPFADLDPKYKVVVWRGDITTLKIDAIVNAANCYMLGCFTPGHLCIDNVIHSFAGPRLRQECRQMMKDQPLEPTGKAKMTKAYCLPSKFVLHTVGPIISRGGPEQPELLGSCYKECLELCKKEGIKSIAFCCISTGVFGYPQEPAAKLQSKP
eukprot:TRINITY_DN4077_c0_g1_i1.p1 TRINITY_DN4077_c0_g1~~TRINITY_DN4077_c0_g1_i1.p1  ORF type:complete len:251 (-),score=61.45 TRINITY_DN4077_c0_g1_i1:152-904(-)